MLNQNEGKSSPCFPYFPTFTADSKRRDNRRPAFLISLHLVLTLNVRKIFALLSLSRHLVLTLSGEKTFALLSVFPYI